MSETADDAGEDEELRCIQCGDLIHDEDDAVYGQGSVNKDGLKSLGDGEEVGADELFAFDDGPYCSMPCSIKAD